MRDRLESIAHDGGTDGEGAAMGIDRYRELELREGRSGNLDADLILRTLFATDPGAASTGASPGVPSRPNR